MRSAFALLAAVCILATNAMADIGPKPDLPRPSVPPIKICSPFVPNHWRAAIMVPMTWSFFDCGNYASELTATAFQVGCVYADSRPGPQYALARVNSAPLPAADCGWASGSAMPWTAPAKVCSIFTPNAWRSLTMVPASWTPADCQAFARAFHATRIHLGCIHHGTAAPKYSWARRPTPSDRPFPGALYMPVADCGWASGGMAPARPFPLKFCSGFVDGAWRNITVVPPSWRPSDCQIFSRQIGATFYQLGCIYDDVPAGSSEKFEYGARFAISRPATEAPILRTCGWRFT